MLDTVAYDELPVKVTRSRRKTLVLHVTREEVEVRAPTNCPATVIADFVQSKEDWIRRTLAELSMRPTREPASFLTGSEHFYLGDTHRLEVIVAPRRFVERSVGRITLGSVDPGNEEKNSRILFDWYRDEAARQLPARVTECLSRFPPDWPVPSLRYRRMKSRWGSCSSKGEICFNTLLMRQPASAIDLVVVHELCHLRHFGHDAAFYGAMTRAMPDWRTRERLLVT